MTNKTTSILLKTLTIILFILGLALHLGHIPILEQRSIAIFLMITGIPCYGVLFFTWKICIAISKNSPFIKENVKRLKNIFWLILLDTIFFFGGSLVFFLTEANPTGWFVVSIIFTLCALSFALAIGTLTALTQRSVLFQEDSDYTV